VEELYLRRWVIARTPWFQVLLHKIFKPDPDNDMHNHPWSFKSFILKGGYIEQTPLWTDEGVEPKAKFTWKGALSWAGQNEFSFHRIATLPAGPTWTLVFTSGKRKSWGFLAKGKYVPWRDYLRAKGQPVTAEIGDDW
jgi:hypothetical protein